MSYRLVLLLALGFQSFNALAANDLDKWNSPEGRQVRTALKNKTTPTTTYREMPNVVDAEYRSTSNGGKVLHRIEQKVTSENGSKVGTTIEALKVPNKSAVAQKWANQLFKGGVRFTAGAILIEVAMQEMLDGLQWIIDEGSKVQKKNPAYDNETTVKDYHQYIYSTNSVTGTVELASYNAAVSARMSQISSSYVNITVSPVACSAATTLSTCVAAWNFRGTPKNGTIEVSVGYIIKRPNPKYNPSSVNPLSPTVPVTQPEVKDKINDYLNNSSNTSKDLLIEEAYKPTGKGYIQWSDDPESRVEIFGDTPNLAKNIYDSDNPVADGLTKSTPKITDSTTLEGETTPNPNPEPPTIPDPVTGQPIPNPNYNPNLDTGSTSSFQLPAFCNYASKLCDWLDWTQQDLEEENTEELQPPSDQGIFDRVFNFNFNFGGQCPPNYTFVMNTQYFGGTKTFDLSWLCMIFTFLGYPLIFLSHCLGFWIFYEVAARKEFKW